MIPVILIALAGTAVIVISIARSVRTSDADPWVSLSAPKEKQK